MQFGPMAIGWSCIAEIQLLGLLTVAEPSLTSWASISASGKERTQHAVRESAKDGFSTATLSARWMWRPLAFGNLITALNRFVFAAVHESANGPNANIRSVALMAACRGKADSIRRRRDYSLLTGNGQQPLMASVCKALGSRASREAVTRIVLFLEMIGFREIFPRLCLLQIRCLNNGIIATCGLLPTSCRAVQKFVVW
jgi:hypothetical protein